MTELATLAGVDLRTFKTWLTPDDLRKMFDLGWNPWGKMLTPAVVRYLREKIIDGVTEEK